MRTRWRQSDKQDSDSSRDRMRARWMTGAEGFGEHCREERTRKEIQQNLIVHLTLPSRSTHLANMISIREMESTALCSQSPGSSRSTSDDGTSDGKTRVVYHSVPRS